jgi:glycerophosphoryl diester phosphodiesterase
MIIAHRAGKPENTLQAFENCVLNNIKAIEFDVHLTKDQHIIVFHDFDVSGVQISSLTVQEIRELNNNIPTLSEVLEVIEETASKNDLSVPLLNVEIKPWGLSKIVAQFIKDYCDGCVCLSLNRFVFTSFLHADVLEVRNVLPSARIGFIYASWPIGLVSTLKEHNLDLVILNNKTLNTEQIGTLHFCHIECWVYTINDKSRSRYLLNDLKIDGVITDVPLEMRE